MNGERRGVTPLALRDLPLGAYDRARHPRRVRRRRAARHARRRPAVAGPRGGAARATRRPPAAAPAPAPPAPRRRAACSSTAVRAGARVARRRPRGRRARRSPWPAGAAGDHAVRIELAGYQPITTTTRVEPGARARVAVSLTSERPEEMNAILALEDGTWYQGVAAGAAGETSGRSRVQHEHDRLSGGADRSVLCRADRHDDRRRRSATTASPATDIESDAPQVAGFIMRDQSPMASNWRAQGTLQDYLVAQRHRRHRRHRHPRADPQAALGRRDARRHRHRPGRSAGAGREGARSVPQMEGADLVKDVTCAGAYDFSHVARRHGGRRPASASPPERRASRRAARRRLRLRHQDQHPAPPGRAQLRRAGVPGVGAGRRACWPGSPTASSSATAPATRPRWATRIDNVKALVAAGRADLRHLPRPPAARRSASAPTTYKLKFGHRGANHPVKQLDVGPGRDHLAEPRLRRRSRLAARRASR